jgi:hypothetical protein
VFLSLNWIFWTYIGRFSVYYVVYITSTANKPEIVHKYHGKVMMAGFLSGNRKHIPNPSSHTSFSYLPLDHHKILDILCKSRLKYLSWLISGYLSLLWATGSSRIAAQSLLGLI